MHEYIDCVWDDDDAYDKYVKNGYMNTIRVLCDM